MDVSIIIVAWNVKELVRDCLKSVFDETKGIDFEVIYVDNASKDGSVEMVSQQFPKVKIIENKKNEGFIKANNQGIEIAEGRYVLLLNSDTVILDNAIAKTVKFAESHPEAAVFGCKVLNPDKTLQRTCSMYPSLLNMFLSAIYLYKIFPGSRFFGREEMTWWDFDDVRKVEVVYGCFSLVRKEAIDQVGLMDPLYFVYGDDPDWCYRFHKAGWEIMFTPEPEIIHYGGQNTKHISQTFRLQLSGSILIFMRLHRSKNAFPFACFLTALFFGLRVPYWLGVAILNKNERTSSIQTAKTYLIGSFYCLTNWKKLLMNKEEVSEIL
ncbi:MAG TPA: glycosyltransferase family 2 protein [Planctomycetes bacterium]|nr:glycosyltransferase family 2 protein [Planctomycetota bacterium]